jgi:hypothetical protein
MEAADAALRLFRCASISCPAGGLAGSGGFVAGGAAFRGRDAFPACNPSCGRGVLR